MEGLGISKSKGLSMVRRLFLAVAVLVIVCGRQAVKAEPITYKFSGQLYLPTPPAHFGPMGGPAYFNGSFTIDPEATVPSQIPFTVNVLGQKLESDDRVLPNQNGIGPDGNPMMQIGFGANDHTNMFSISFLNSRMPNELANLKNFEFSTSTVHSIFLEYMNNTGADDMAHGILTSVEAIPTPEPESLIIFAMLGTAAWAHRRRCSSKKPAMEGH